VAKDALTMDDPAYGVGSLKILAGNEEITPPWHGWRQLRSSAVD